MHRQDAEYTLKHHPCVLALIENPQTRQLLMIKHLRGINQGYRNFPGGKMEMGESITDALLREVKEETGLTLKKAKCIGRFDITSDGNQESPDIFSTSDDIHVYVFYSDKFSGELSAAKGEVEVFWQDRHNLPYDQMRDNDKIWLPDALKGKTFHKTFFRNQEGRLEETWHDDNNVEDMLEIRFRQYEMMKNIKGR